MISGKDATRTIREHFLTSSALFTKLQSPIFPALFYQNYTQPDDNFYDNNVRDASEEENDNIDLNYSTEENDENAIINTNQLSESEILSGLYKTTEKNSEAAQHLLRSDQLEKVQRKIEKHKDALA